MGKKYVRVQELEPERQKNAKVIAVMNNKGGCGKTSTAMALGMYLVRTGHNVLFWDGDPQSNLTQRLGIPDDLDSIKRINMLMKNPEDNEDITQIMEYPYLQRVPGSDSGVGIVGLMPGDHMSETEAKFLETRFEDYGRATEKLIGHSSITNYVQSIFDEKKRYFDYIILDTAPALQGNTLNVVALKTVDEIIYPIDSLEAMAGIDEILGWMSNQIRHRTKPNGLFAMVKYQADTKEFDYSGNGRARNAVFRSMKKVFKDFVCEHGVKELKSMRLSKKSIPGFGGKTEYTALCREILEKISLPDRKNIFDYVEENGAVKALEFEISTLSKMIVKRKPHRKIPQYTINKNIESVVDEPIGNGKTIR